MQGNEDLCPPNGITDDNKGGNQELHLAGLCGVIRKYCKTLGPSHRPVLRVNAALPYGREQ